MAAPAAKTFVLVHGAWHGGWCWRRVADLLERQGHKVFTPTLTGLGERAHLMSKDMNLIMETAKAVGADLAAGCEAKSVLDANLKASGDLDLSAITPFVVHRANEQSHLRQVSGKDKLCA